MTIKKIIKRQDLFFKTGKTRATPLKKQLLVQLKLEIEAREQDIYKALYSDFKKSSFETYLSEIAIVNTELNLAIKSLKKWSRPRRVRASMLNFPSTDYIYSEPYGRVLIIAPWNYPFQLAIAPVIAAIAAGNTCVLKPSELTPHTSQLISEIINKVFHAEHVAVVQGGVSVATKVLNEKWDYIFFTGSVPVGKIVAQTAAKYMTPITLELGGKNSCVVDNTVNTTLVARRLVWGKFVNAGQTCIAPDYIIAHRDIKSELINAIKNEIKNAYGHNPEESEDYPRIVNAKNLKRLSKMLTDVNVIYGGKINEEDHYLSPTIIDEPPLTSEVMKDEIFGPILPILSFASETEIDNIISTYEKPLAFYVFSKDSTFSKRLMTKYSFGGGAINDTMVQFANYRLPFGGVGESGIGSYHGRFGFNTFSHQKAVVKKGNWIDIPTRYAPYKGKLKNLKSLFKWFS